MGQIPKLLLDGLIITLKGHCTGTSRIHETYPVEGKGRDKYKISGRFIVCNPFVLNFKACIG